MKAPIGIGDSQRNPEIIRAGRSKSRLGILVTVPISCYTSRQRHGQKDYHPCYFTRAPEPELWFAMWQPRGRGCRAVLRIERHVS